MSRPSPADGFVATLVEAAIAGATPTAILEALCRAMVGGRAAARAGPRWAPC